jgi:hypothetical protein
MEDGLKAMWMEEPLPREMEEMEEMSDFHVSPVIYNF